MGHAVHEASVEAKKPDGERETAYRARNLPFLVKRLAKRIADLHPPHEAALLRRACAAAAKLPIGLLPEHLAQLEATAVALESGDASRMPRLLALDAAALEKLLEGGVGGEGGEGGGGYEDDAAVVAAAALYPAYTADRDAAKALLSERDQLIAALLELQKVRCFSPSPREPSGLTPHSAACLLLLLSLLSLLSLFLPSLSPSLSPSPSLLPPFSPSSSSQRPKPTPFATPQAHATDETFYPDANSCLRLSAGHVEGYTAADAVQHTPVTTLGGLVDKHLEDQLSGASGGGGGGDGGEAASATATTDMVKGAGGEFDCPTRLVELCAADAAVAATPCCVLYSTDTVGGNSGSPVLDADGNFVAINFDRQRLGLMNEFKWSRCVVKREGGNRRRRRRCLPASYVPPAPAAARALPHSVRSRCGLATNKRPEADGCTAASLARLMRSTTAAFTQVARLLALDWHRRAVHPAARRPLRRRPVARRRDGRLRRRRGVGGAAGLDWKRSGGKWRERREEEGGERGGRGQGVGREGEEGGGVGGGRGGGNAQLDARRRTPQGRRGGAGLERRGAFASLWPVLRHGDGAGSSDCLYVNCSSHGLSGLD